MSIFALGQLCQGRPVESGSKNKLAYVEPKTFANSNRDICRLKVNQILEIFNLRFALNLKKVQVWSNQTFFQVHNCRFGTKIPCIQKYKNYTHCKCFCCKFHNISLCFIPRYISVVFFTTNYCIQRIDTAIIRINGTFACL